jgi:hypothetical protein
MSCAWRSRLRTWKLITKLDAPVFPNNESLRELPRDSVTLIGPALPGNFPPPATKGGMFVFRPIAQVTEAADVTGVERWARPRCVLPEFEEQSTSKPKTISGFGGGRKAKNDRCVGQGQRTARASRVPRQPEPGAIRPSAYPAQRRAVMGAILPQTLTRW